MPEGREGLQVLNTGGGAWGGRLSSTLGVVRCGRSAGWLCAVCAVGHIGCCVWGEYPVGVSISSSPMYQCRMQATLLPIALQVLRPLTPPPACEPLLHRRISPSSGHMTRTRGALVVDVDHPETRSSYTVSVRGRTSRKES